MGKHGRGKEKEKERDPFWIQSPASQFKPTKNEEVSSWSPVVASQTKFMRTKGIYHIREEEQITNCLT